MQTRQNIKIYAVSPACLLVSTHLNRNSSTFISLKNESKASNFRDLRIVIIKVNFLSSKLHCEQERIGRKPTGCRNRNAFEILPTAAIST